MRQVKTLIPAFLILISATTNAREWPSTRKGGTTTTSRAGQCAPATARTYLELNNVRALIETGGRMWQDRSTSTAAYEVPKGSNKFAIYSGALWMGGVDATGQLRIAANLFGQGNDFWPGPLQTDNTANVSEETCTEWDRFYHITRAEVDEFKARYGNDITYEVPNSIKEWPAHGGPGEDYYMAPFHDSNGDGRYRWQDGDYPDYGECQLCGDREAPVPLFGDDTYWWVFNDNGNVHTESGAEPIGMEIRAQAFAFATNDELNNMTFYNYQVINRSTYTLHDAYFAQWVDADLGNYEDDYVGCDVARGLGYVYNGYAVDDGPRGYGANPPAIGVDFFQGPYVDDDGMDNPGPTIDNNYFVSYQDAITNNGIVYPGVGVGYGDGCPDNERFGMRAFFYFTGGATNQNMSDPEYGNPQHFYNYMIGKWKNGQDVVYGGDGFSGSGIQTDYCFPGDSDPLGWATGGQPQPDWTEANSNLLPGDRRMVQSAGPFTLEPGAVNNVTVGVVYARAASGDPFASVRALQTADDKAQALFDNCFKIMEGPHAPEVAIQELDRELIISLSNHPLSNNANEDYEEIDPFIPEQITDAAGNSYQPDRTYRFQGYIVYQLKNAEVSVSDLSNVDVARPVFQCDVKDGVANLVNFEHDETIGYSIPELKVEAADNGIEHAFSVKEDLFATGDRRLVNHKTYHYLAIAYAHNNYKTYDPSDPNGLDGQKTPFASSRKAIFGAIQSYSGIPHIPSPEAYGTIQQAEFGDGPMITRIEGEGNGGRTMHFTASSEASIVANNYLEHPTYIRNLGPVDIRVIDPLNVPTGSFELRFLPDSNGLYSDNSQWVLINQLTQDSVYSRQSIAMNYEQLIPELGIAIQVEEPVYETDNTNKYTEMVHSSIEYGDSSKPWLIGLEDQDNNSFLNWIRIGSQFEPPFEDIGGFNVSDDFENIVGGTWASYKSLADTTNSPAPGQYFVRGTALKIAEHHSVDIVITPDRNLWTRCPVVETLEDQTWIQGVTEKGAMRDAASVDQFGQPDGTGNGMGWFPGYAIDLETGERLNMAFGEDSHLANENGRDMMWNPSSNVISNLGTIWFGGKHYIYVFKNREDQGLLGRYDGGNNIESMMQTSTGRFKVWRSCMWVGCPLTHPDHSLLDTDVRISIQVAKRHEERTVFNENNGLPMYQFSLDGLATLTEDNPAAEEALNLINMVPNPYYGYSQYEVNKVDNRVKITNLPVECSIQIYTLNGTLVKSFSKDSPATSIDWNLKNNKGIPISSGVYLIHINAPGIGERVIKWFGAMRPIDLDNF